MMLSENLYCYYLPVSTQHFHLLVFCCIQSILCLIRPNLMSHFIVSCRLNLVDRVRFLKNLFLFILLKVNIQQKEVY